MTRASIPSLDAPPPAGPLGSALAPVVVLVVVAVVPVGLVLTLDSSTYDIWGVFVWAPLMLLASLPVCRFVVRRTADPEAIRFLMGAALLKVVVGAVAQYAVVESIYSGRADATRYDRAAELLAPQLRALDFSDLGKISGTRFQEVLTGVVQAGIGDTKLGTFVVFSFFGFVGMCLLYLAFCEALPDGDRRLYRRFLFLVPSMWFWPSTIGKEAFLMLCLGATTYGLALAFSGRLGGLVPGLLGAWGMAVVRPHILVILLVGVAAALAFGDGRSTADHEASASGRALAARVGIATVVVALSPILLGTVERFFNIEGFNVENVTAVRDEVALQTDLGGSEFDPPDTSTLPGFVAGIVTVLVRPFPWEVSGAQMLTALESVVVAIIAARCIVRRKGRWFRALWRQWCRLSWAYVVAFSWAFAVVGNFGLLARQRSLMLPMLFVLIACVPRPEPAAVVARQRAATSDTRRRPPE